MLKTSKPLPKVAENFRQKNKHLPGACSICACFHRWLELQQLARSELTQADIENFIKKHVHKKNAAEQQQKAYQNLHHYLTYLYETKQIDFIPKPPGYLPQQLPEYARRFLDILAITLKPRTCIQYKYTLNQFYRFLNQNKIQIDQLRRKDITGLLMHLIARKLHPVTRQHLLLNLRSYLRWLYDEGLLKENPENLLRTSDLPKLPNYLPRPLPEDIDYKLQQYLTANSSKSLMHSGLLLMRMTGIRIGELINLSYDCVYSDHLGNHSLKVPLGKLNSERLVPIDEKAFQIIKTIQLSNKNNKGFLLQTKQHLPLPYSHFRATLHEAASNIGVEPASLTSHRLRHTYASVLLNAGVSIPALMKLLGHNHHKMTLRYAAITQATVRTQYFKAIDQIQTQLAQKPTDVNPSQAHPAALIDLAIRAISKNAAQSPPHKVKLNNLIKRLNTIKNNLPK